MSLAVDDENGSSELLSLGNWNFLLLAFLPIASHVNTRLVTSWAINLVGNKLMN